MMDEHDAVIEAEQDSHGLPPQCNGCKMKDENWCLDMDKEHECWADKKEEVKEDVPNIRPGTPESTTPKI